MSGLEKMDKNRNALLLAAAGALLHNLGKICPQFIQCMMKIGCADYLYQRILEKNILHEGTKQALSNQKMNLSAPFNDREYAPSDFIRYLGQGNKEPWYRVENGKYEIEDEFPGGSRLTHLINRAHRGASGGEKTDIAVAGQANGSQLWRSTPMGWEVPVPSLNSAIPHHDKDIDTLLKEIETIIQNYLLSPTNPFPFNDFASALRPKLTESLADSQRPLNDITIWDVGHTATALLVSQAVGMLLEGKSISHDDMAKEGKDTQLHWRLLSVRTDGLRYLEQAVSIADLRVRRKRVLEAVNKVQKKLETDLSLSMEIYRDENGSFYLLSNAFQPESQYWEDLNKEIGSELEIDGVKLTVELSPEPLVCHPGDADPLLKNYIGSVLNEQINQLPKLEYDKKSIETSWGTQSRANSTRKEVCIACQLRPQGYGVHEIPDYQHNPEYYSDKASRRNICGICMYRRVGVSKQWATNNHRKDTIWTDEVADINGRMALITGHWDLDGFSREVVYPHKKHFRNKKQSEFEIEVEFFGNVPSNNDPFKINDRNYYWSANRNRLVGENPVESANGYNQQNIVIEGSSGKHSSLLQSVQKRSDGEYYLTLADDLTKLLSVKINQIVKAFGDQLFLVVESNVLKPTDDASCNRLKKSILWNQKHPFKIQNSVQTNEFHYIEITNQGGAAKSESLARLRRIWETSRQFWQEVLPIDNELDKSLVARQFAVKQKRLEIRGELQSCNASDKNQLGKYHVYDLVLSPGITLSVVWDSKENRLITADNLDYLAKPEFLNQSVTEWLEERLNSSFDLNEPTGYGNLNKPWGQITLTAVHEIPDSDYFPVIPILAEPRTFMALVPADKALDIIAAIKTKYEREMGKVRCRLPLHLGTVFAHRRTPLRAILDAGRRMLQQPAFGRDAPWLVESDAKMGSLPNDQQPLGTDTQHFQQTIQVDLTQEDRKITWYVPAVMGDGVTTDNWYPYLFIHTNEDASGQPTQPSGRTKTFKGHRHTNEGSKECWLIHVSELKQGNKPGENDKVYFTPATWDFEWLDTSSRRFEIAYDDRGRRHGRHIRPYLLDECETIQKIWELIAGIDGLSASQINALRNLIETRRTAWEPAPKDKTYLKWCRTAVRNAEWKRADKPTDAEKNQLSEWAARGLLADTIELYMEILKERPQREEPSGAFS